MRARLTPTRRDAVQAQLAGAVRARGARRSGDLLRIATWRLESGTGFDGALFAHAADAALAARDAQLAERLARAAGAELALGRALAASGRGDESEAVLGALAARDDRERAAVALARARNLFWALDRAGDADAVLRDAERAVADEDLRHELTAQRVRLTAAHGRPRPALAAGAELLDKGSVPERARLTAVLGMVEALFTSGRAEAAVALVDTWLPAARRCEHELPHAEPVLVGMRAGAMRLAGRLVEATALSERAYEVLLARRSAAATAVEGEHARPDLARPRPGSHRAASVSRERRAAARRRRGRDAGLRAGRRRPGRGAGRRAGGGARGDRGARTDAAGA